MSNRSDSKAICVLGMHRSGTSAVTRALNLLGVYLGEPEKLIGPNEQINPKGYWEFREIVDFHETLLNILGRNWRDIDPFKADWWKNSEIQREKQTLSNIIKNSFEDHSLWGWKDPRSCLTIPLWNEILKELNTRISFLIVIRNPVDIARSLYNRDKQPVEQTYLLWQLYIISALLETKNQTRSLIHYDDFINDWKHSLRKISKDLDIPWPSDHKKLEYEMDSFLEKDLRHSQSSLDDLKLEVKNKKLPESLVYLSELCLKSSMDQDFLCSKELNIEINKISAEYQAYVNTIETNLNRAQENKKKVLHFDNLQRESLEKVRHIDNISDTWSLKFMKPLRVIRRFLTGDKH